MKTVGLTGGIGSGKTTVCHIFEALSVPVFYADTEAKKLYSDPDVLAKVEQIAGMPICHSDGTLNRKALADILFAYPQKLAAINTYIHPLVAERYEQWKTEYVREALYCIREAAILFESGSHADCFRVIVVTAPEEERIRRVVQRDGISPNDVRMRMNVQMPEDEKIANADYIIHNDGSQPLIMQVVSIHHNIINHCR